MNDISQFGQEIEARYRDEFLPKKFPYTDCYSLQKRYPTLKNGLIPDLDLYFSYIAGFSSSGSRLEKRPLKELQAAESKLKKSFFETFPRYAPFAQAMSSNDVPSLSLQLSLADKLRTDLLVIIRRLIQPDGL